MFKDAKQGVWDGVQEQILIRMLRKWGRRYKSDDEENLPVICRTIQLLYFKFCHIILTLSFFHCTLVLLILADYLNSLSLLSRSPPLPAVSLVSCGRPGKFDLLGTLIVFLSQLSFAINCIDCFSITTFICFKDHFFSRCDKMIRLALFLGSAIVVARLIQTSLNKYFKISFLIQLFNLPFNFTFILHFQDQFCSLPVSPQSGSIRGKPIKVSQIIFEGI